MALIFGFILWLIIKQANKEAREGGFSLNEK